MKFEVLRAVNMSMFEAWVITPRGLVRHVPAFRKNIHFSSSEFVVK